MNQETGSVLGDVADWATIIALVVALFVFLIDLMWRRRVRAKELLRDLIGPGSDEMIREVRRARDALGIDSEVVTSWGAEQRRLKWKEVLNEVDRVKAAGDPDEDERVVHVNTIIVFHNRLEEIADGYLSWFASRQELKSALHLWLVAFARTYEGFYEWFIERDATRDPPTEHGYVRIRKLVEKAAARQS